MKFSLKSETKVTKTREKCMSKAFDEASDRISTLRKSCEANEELNSQDSSSDFENSFRIDFTANESARPVRDALTNRWLIKLTVDNRSTSEVKTIINKFSIIENSGRRRKVSTSGEIAREKIDKAYYAPFFRLCVRDEEKHMNVFTFCFFGGLGNNQQVEMSSKFVATIRIHPSI